MDILYGKLHMELKDTILITATVGNRVNFYWNFYMMISMIIIGWLIALNSQLTYELKYIITILYVIVSGINLTALIREYKLLSALIEELKLSIDKDTFKSHELFSHVGVMSFKNRIVVTMLLYGICMGSVLYLVWKIH